jgi:hypothetical protein
LRNLFVPTEDHLSDLSQKGEKDTGSRHYLPEREPLPENMLSEGDLVAFHTINTDNDAAHWQDFAGPDTISVKNAKASQFPGKLIRTVRATATKILILTTDNRRKNTITTGGFLRAHTWIILVTGK